MGMPAGQAGPFSSNAAGFVGDLVDGVRHGYGVQTYRNGAKYAGEWKSDHPDGWGVILAADGRQSVGRFAINPRHGRGVRFFVNGEIDDNDQVYWEEGVLIDQSEWFASENRREFESESLRMGLPLSEDGELSSEEKVHILAEFSGDWMLELPGMFHLAMMATVYLHRHDSLKWNISLPETLCEVLAREPEGVAAFCREGNLSHSDGERLMRWAAWFKSAEKAAVEAHLGGRCSEIGREQGTKGRPG